MRNIVHPMLKNWKKQSFFLCWLPNQTRRSLPRQYVLSPSCSTLKTLSQSTQLMKQPSSKGMTNLPAARQDSIPKACPSSPLITHFRSSIITSHTFANTRPYRFGVAVGGVKSLAGRQLLEATPALSTCRSIELLWSYDRSKNTSARDSYKHPFFLTLLKGVEDQLVLVASSRTLFS